MAAGAIRHVLSYLDAVSSDTECDDGLLLDAFLSRRDEAAFALLVRRLGPVVWGACRRLLGDGPDAEDAFQATFLVLLRRATDVRPRSAVGPWLHGVAVRTARKVRAVQGRQRRRETALPDLPSARPGDVDLFDWKPLLDRELSRLPERYRSAILLCDLQGLSRQDAARQLGLAEGTLSSRLARGRERLRQRLVRAGVSLSTGALATALVADRADAVPVALRAAVMQMAAMAGAGGVSPSVAALGNGVIQAMGFKKMKLTAAIVLSLVVIGGGFGLGGHSSNPAAPVSVAVAAPDEKPAPLAKPAPPANPAEKRYAFEVRDKRWRDVLEWLSEKTQVPINTPPAMPVGTFTFVAPTNPDGSVPTYTIPEIIEIINEALNARDLQLVRLKHSYTLVPLDPDRTKTAGNKTAFDDLKLLQGPWTVLSGVYTANDQSGFVPARAKIDGDRLTLTFRKPSGEEKDAAMIPTIRLNPNATPKQIDIRTGFGPTEYVKRGIYSLQGDTLILALQSDQDKGRPADFVEDLKGGQSLMILRREKTDAAKPAAEKVRDLDRLQGAWDLVSSDSGSGEKKKPPDPSKSRVVFESNGMYVREGGTAATNSAYMVQLNDTRDPKEIDLTYGAGPQPVEMKGRGIYSLSGDVLMLCLTFDDKEARPTDFTVPRGSKRILHILRREPSSHSVRPDSKPTMRSDAGMIERIDDIHRKMADMQTEIAKLRDELRKAQGKKP